MDDNSNLDCKPQFLRNVRLHLNFQSRNIGKIVQLQTAIPWTKHSNPKKIMKNMESFNLEIYLHVVQSWQWPALPDERIPVPGLR